MTKPFLGSFEEIVLLSMLRLGDDAYGVKIRQTVEGAVGHSVSVGAIYATLERLERKKFVSSRRGEPSAERGGRAKRYFKVEAPGAKALNEATIIRQRLGVNLGFETA